jgi:hypothetical protein
MIQSSYALTEIEMAKTIAERQAQHRAKAQAKCEKRLCFYTSQELHTAVDLMAKFKGMTQREVLEDLVRREHARLCIDLPEAEFERYNTGTKAT